jgi:NhaA family Na+:H+ antiporter
VASVILRVRNQVYRRISEAERVDRDGDDIPDVYQDQPRA